VCACVLSENIKNIKEKREVLLEASRELDLDVNTEKTKLYGCVS
jgi:hypothetical protein